MGWGIASNSRHQRLFFSLRLRLLLAYLVVMAASLGVFGFGVYGFVVRSLYRQLDKRLLTLAQAATLTQVDIERQGHEYLDNVEEVPWRDIFNRDRQSLEWFDVNRSLLASKGIISIARPPKLGPQTLHPPDQPYPVRTYAISVFSDSPDSVLPSLEGYVRASQSMEDLVVAQSRLLWGLGLGGSVALGCIGVGGLWLTKRALEPVEQSFQRLRQFTADASHELRGPLTVMQGFVDLMQVHPERVHPADERKLAALSSATEQMTHLTEDLLLLARADAGVEASDGDRGRICLSELLGELVAETYDRAKRAEIQLQFRPAETAKTEIWGDAMRLRRLFGNLIDNAIQYTPAGGTVEVQVDRSPRWIEVAVTDTGIGIPAEHLQAIFERFWRAEEARTHRENGSGLGLAIAQTIARQHGGKIAVSSMVGKGSYFQVALPGEMKRVEGKRQHSGRQWDK
ncbi:cell wall metabolism sensor histidine kinase WalK [Synechococcus sp. PCC 7336]|uniref:sensor histidine kinase n=1 Tax=Synechococcus sp. PCC 7336 TaxID=195250 RepID=UPI0003453662|nr:HAMP domain-containing sensor histidine kinase [Synechococcus sp. PCC 7336]